MSTRMDQKHISSSISPTRRHRSGAEYPTSGQLVMAPPTTTTATAITPYRPLLSRFNLPPGWGVEEVPRSTGHHIDRYYYEPGTGLKYRSLREVERRLNGEIVAPRTRVSTRRNYSKSSLSRKMVIYDGKMVCMDQEKLNEWAIVPSTCAATVPYDLPDGWVIEEVPRRDGSLVDKKSPPCTRNIVRENSDKSSFLSPPAKVNWVLSSPRGDAWNPFIAGTPIPDSVKQQWTKRFMLLMNDETLNAENSN
ncbi:methyl-CpG-binding domain-containing protein 7 isoform X4 [Capsicum annuum]|uniref:methyl-CpG-binding domain-containing protein 7 isoform X4 n=1 Tax=Capsicum annuum TaxID=4072 RepID=UPI001FB15F44|nr:methyl-CpG-binding domain-containing protein 7 isoform X4 [Capsicum annuum]